MWDFILTDTSSKLYAISHFNKGNSNWSEFFEYLKRIKDISKKIKKSKENPEKINQIIEMLIDISNKFEKDSFGRLIFYYTNDISVYPLIKTFLIFLHRMPYYIPELDLSLISIDEELLEHLKKI